MICLSISDPLRLPEIIDLVHDRWFNIEEIQFDADRAELLIPFRSSVRIRERGDIEYSYLRIHWVTDYHLRDTNQVGIYDFNELEYDARSRCLRITTGIPLDFEVEVRNFGLTVEIPKNPGE